MSTMYKVLKVHDEDGEDVPEAAMLAAVKEEDFTWIEVEDVVTGQKEAHVNIKEFVPGDFLLFATPPGMFQVVEDGQNNPYLVEVPK